MKNYIQSGDVITVAAPADVSSGDFVAIGALFGVAQASAMAGEDVALATRGVFQLPVINAAAIQIGAKVYMATDGVLDIEPTDGGDPAVAHELVGVSVSEALEVVDATAQVRVKLG